MSVARGTCDIPDENAALGHLDCLFSREIRCAVKRLAPPLLTPGEKYSIVTERRRLLEKRRVQAHSQKEADRRLRADIVRANKESLRLSRYAQGLNVGRSCLPKDHATQGAQGVLVIREKQESLQVSEPRTFATHVDRVRALCEDARVRMSCASAHSKMLGEIVQQTSRYLDRSSTFGSGELTPRCRYQKRRAAISIQCIARGWLLRREIKSTLPFYSMKAPRSISHNNSKKWRLQHEVARLKHLQHAHSMLLTCISPSSSRSVEEEMLCRGTRMAAARVIQNVWLQSKLGEGARERRARSSYALIKLRKSKEGFVTRTWRESLLKGYAFLPALISFQRKYRSYMARKHANSTCEKRAKFCGALTVGLANEREITLHRWRTLLLGRGGSLARQVANPSLLSQLSQVGAAREGSPSSSMIPEIELIDASFGVAVMHNMATIIRLQEQCFCAWIQYLQGRRSRREALLLRVLNQRAERLQAWAHRLRENKVGLAQEVRSVIPAHLIGLHEMYLHQHQSWATFLNYISEWMVEEEGQTCQSRHSTKRSAFSSLPGSAVPPELTLHTNIINSIVYSRLQSEPDPKLGEANLTRRYWLFLWWVGHHILEMRRSATCRRDTVLYAQTVAPTATSSFAKRKYFPSSHGPVAHFQPQ
jgi:hypothetical protein